MSRVSNYKRREGENVLGVNDFKYRGDTEKWKGGHFECPPVHFSTAYAITA